MGALKGLAPSMKKLFQFLQRPLASVAALSFFVNLLLLGPALFMMQVFDRILVSRSVDTLLVLLLGTLFALGLSMVLDYLRGRLQGVIGNLVAESLSPVVARMVLARSARRSLPPGSANMRDVASLRNVFSAQGLLAVFDLPWVVVYVAVIWLAHAALGITAALCALAILGFAVLNDRLTRTNIEQLQEEAWRTNRFLDASLENAEVVETLGMGNALLGRWRRMNAQVAQLQRPTARRSVGGVAFTRAFRQAVQILLQSLGAYLVIAGEATPGVMIATTLLLARALAPAEQVMGSWRVLAEGRHAYRRLDQLLREHAQAEASAMALPAPTGRLVADSVAFRVPGTDRVVLAGVSLQLAPGESLAIIGPSGAGKSTLIRVLSGLWRPSAGVVRLDGVDLAQWDRAELGPWLGYVPQDVELFAGTVAENIARLGEVDSEQVVRAARRAGVHEWILSLPAGYDTEILPTAGVLSPGQRQRIALARALYGDPRLVLLDEPNSNLDGAGEQALAEALRAIRGQATVVVVTHRRSLIEHMDKVLVLDAGRVKEFGRVADVLAAARPAAVPGAGQVVPLSRPPSAA